MAQLKLFELVLQLDFLSIGKVKLLWKLCLLLQQLLEVPLLACAGLYQLVIIVAMYLVLVLYMVRIQLILMMLYPSALNIFQLLCKRKSWLEAVWNRLAIDLRIIQKRIHYQLLLLYRRQLVLLLSV